MTTTTASSSTKLKPALPALGVERGFTVCRL
jgi:hypothetical protein